MEKKGTILLKGILVCSISLSVIFLFMFFKTQKNTNPPANGTEPFQSSIVSANEGEIKVNNISMKDIHFLECYKEDDTYRPMVIIQHGLTGKKEEMLDFGKEFARRGYYVIIPDAYGHGENGSQEPASVIEMAVQTAEGYETILKTYDGHKLADNSRLGITGMSMGGLCAFYYAAYGKYKLTVIGSMYSTPDWERLIGQQVLYINRNASTEILITEEEQINRINNFIKEKTPYKQKEVLKEIPMLLINGEKDDVIPLDSVQPFYEELHQNAADMQMEIIKNQGHALTVENLYSIINFFEEYLK